MTTQAATALDRNAEAAAALPPPAPGIPRRVLTLDQERVVEEYVKEYGLDAEQIYFEGSDPTPFFDFEALSILVVRLAPDITRLGTRPMEVNAVSGIVSVACEVTLADGRTRAPSAIAQVGETLPDRRLVESVRTAFNVAQARACRSALRMVGFDVARAHALKKQGVDLTLTITNKDPRQQELAAAHILGEELGLIVGEDKTLWRSTVSAFTHGRLESMADMDDAERKLFITFLQSRKNARGRGGMYARSEEGN